MDFDNLMQKAKAVQDSMFKMCDEMGNVRVEGEAGGGLVVVVLDANNMAKEVKIDPSLINKEKERILLQDLLIAAFNSAHEKAEKKAQTVLSKITEGLDFPVVANF